MSQVIDGQLTIHEETLSLLECVQQDYVIALKPLVKYLQRVAKATAPSDVESARVEPLGMSPWDWICSKNRKLMHAAGQEGMANTIMTMLRGAEVWAKDNARIRRCGTIDVDT